MSNLAYARPAVRPATQPTRAPRHIEIVTTRAQRRARPRAAYAVVTVISLFVIFAAQLLVSIVVSNGAFQISSLQTQEKDLLRTQESLSEQLDVRDSTQFLAANAAKLGMVPGSSPQFLNLETGAVFAAPGTADPLGCGGACNLVQNSLLTGVPLVTPAPAAATSAVLPATSTAATAPVTPAAPAVDPTVPVSTLPTPDTH